MTGLSHTLNDFDAASVRVHPLSQRAQLLLLRVIRGDT